MDWALVFVAAAVAYRRLVQETMLCQGMPQRWQQSLGVCLNGVAVLCWCVLRRWQVHAQRPDGRLSGTGCRDTFTHTYIHVGFWDRGDGLSVRFLVARDGSLSCAANSFAEDSVASHHVGGGCTLAAGLPAEAGRLLHCRVRPDEPCEKQRAAACLPSRQMQPWLMVAGSQPDIYTTAVPNPHSPLVHQQQQ
jgi:hypothetical protein